MQVIIIPPSMYKNYELAETITLTTGETIPEGKLLTEIFPQGIVIDSNAIELTRKCESRITD